MIFKLRIAHWRFTFTFAPVTDVVGVNSNLPDGKHILMWDFDDIPLWLVVTELNAVQVACHLPPIRILQSGLKNHYIAYCFKRVEWWECKAMIASTPDVDPNFFKYGVYREHFTLRVTPKEGRRPHVVMTLPSRVPEDCCIKDLKSWTQYETLADNAPMRKRELNIAKVT